jgi:hypothetical protein
MTQSLSITTFRFVPSDLRARVGEPAVEEHLNALNRGTARPPAARRRGVRLERGDRRPLRAARLHRELQTTREDVEAVPPIVVRVGRELANKLSTTEDTEDAEEWRVCFGALYGLMITKVSAI